MENMILSLTILDCRSHLRFDVFVGRQVLAKEVKLQHTCAFIQKLTVLLRNDDSVHLLLLRLLASEIGNELHLKARPGLCIKTCVHIPSTMTSYFPVLMS